MNNIAGIYFEISVTCAFLILFISFAGRLTNKNYSGKWNYYIWLILAVRMLLPFHLPLIEVPSLFDHLPGYMEDMFTGSESAAPAAVQTIETAPAVSNAPAFDGAVTKQPVTKAEAGSSYDTGSTEGIKENRDFTIPDIIKNNTRILTLVWLAGILIFLLYHGLGYAAFLSGIKGKSKPATDETTTRILSALSEELKIKKALSVKTVPGLATPMLAGILFPKILLPEKKLPDDRLKIVLKHELIHYKHHDLWYKLIFVLTNAIHWYNPFVYHMVRSAENTMETVCDEAVLWQQDEAYRKLYGLTILETLTGKNLLPSTSFSTNFNGGKKKMKDRFIKIMNSSPKKKGSLLFCILFCLILLSGSLILGNRKSTADTAPADITKTPTSGAASDEENPEKQDTFTDTRNFLLVGLDSIGMEDTTENYRSDAILVATVNPAKKEITLTTFSRDLGVDIPGTGKNKLSTAYSTGGIRLLESTLETNFDMKIDGSVIAGFDGFEKIMDLIGGVHVTLTEKEAAYLNKTNYISNPSNRNVKAGEQILNGNQVLGYSRIRHVETADGINGDFGRGNRIRNLLQSAYKTCKTAGFVKILAMLDTALPYVDTDIAREDILTCLKVLFDQDYTLQESQIPAADAYEISVLDTGMQVLNPDIAANKEVLEKITGQ